MKLAAYVSWFAMLILIVSATAIAYDVAGHYYTLTAILNDSYPKGSVEPSRIVESFCAVLPDLAGDLDAVAQRERIFRSLNPLDFTWSQLGVCMTRSCVHMVATQFYLHGLTGTSPKSIQIAAREIVKSLDKKIFESKNASKRDLVNLWCERGFAIHLLGDTYAHADLDDPTVLYKPGVAHMWDYHDPDLVLRRGDDHWIGWVKEVSDIPGNNNYNKINYNKAVADIRPYKWIKDSKDYYNGECWMQERLFRHAGGWAKWSPPIEEWTTSVCSLKPHGNLRQVMNAFKETLPPCQAVVDVGLVGNSKQITTLSKLAQGLPNPDCATVWKNFLSLAIVTFNRQKGVEHWYGSVSKLNPTDLNYWGCDPIDDDLKYGSY